ncbi:adenosine deaminase [Ruania halotolerans]|nr:adenosine deaminase [Ruania halotolerans]
MSALTLSELAIEAGVRIPETLRETVASADPLRLPANERGWFRFQRMYDAARAVVRSEAAMRRLIHEAAQADADEGSRRLEIQVDPTSYAPFVGGITPALEIITDAAREASATTGVETGIIVASSRTRHPLDARTLARLAVRHAGDGAGDVIGFGLSNDERRGNTADFGPAFRIAARAGLLLAPHGGELLGPDHVAEVVAHLHPHRLGHGVRAAEDPALLDRIVAERIALEVCPASNVSLGVFPTAQELPLRRLLAAGADIALGADDPLLFGSRLLAQYETARHVHGMTDAELAELARGSIRASRASTASKAAMLADVGAWLTGPGLRE